MGGAAANIGGQTLNSAFNLPRSFGISAISNQKRRDNLMNLLSNLRLGKVALITDLYDSSNGLFVAVIVDEYSMLKSDQLYQLDFRLW